MRSRTVRHHRDDGVTLIELVIVTTIFVIGLGLAIPNLVSSRIETNEVSALSHVLSVATAQTQFHETAMADEDFDGEGEFGTFAEMGGRVGVRGLSAKMPSDLTASMSLVDVAGEVHRSGFVFRIYLPRADGTGQREEPYGGIPAGMLEPSLAEEYWVCYAWPISNGISGGRTFFINQALNVLHTTEDRRSGQNSAYVRAGDAFQSGDPDGMLGEPAAGTTGSDGNDWQPLN